MVQGLKRHWLLRSAFKNKGKEESSKPGKRPSPTRRASPPEGRGAGIAGDDADQKQISTKFEEAPNTKLQGGLES
jgi:hypothetical protein